MKKFLLITLVAILAIGGFLAWVIFASATSFPEKTKAVFVQSYKLDEDNIIQLLKDNGIKNTWVLTLVGDKMNIWNKIKPGKYELPKGASILTIARMLRNNKQAQIKLVINKIRTKEDLARLISKSFFIDSSAAMQQFSKIDANTFLTTIIPNTYSFYWNTSIPIMMDKIATESKLFWKQNNRTQKAADAGFSPQQIYTIASIVEEETNKDEDKGKVASVYMNRLNKGMPLAADPTVKFALKDFTLKRILYTHLKVQSPYNTYINKGLPPGPICTPSIKTIDAVLNAPKTDYLFFVAKDDFSGYSHFSNSFAEHDKYAKAYQKALDIYLKSKQ